MSASIMQTGWSTIQTGWSSQLTTYTQLFLRWWWFIITAMIIATGSASIFPNITMPESYTATIMIQLPSPSATFTTGSSSKNINTFYPDFFVDPVVLEPVLLKHKDLQLSDLQTLITATPITGTNVLQLTASGATPKDASTLVNDVYTTSVNILTARRSTVVSSLVSKLNAELVQSRQHAVDYFATLQSLQSTGQGASPAYFQIDALYREQLQIINTINQQLLTLQQQNAQQNGVLALVSSMPQLSTIPGISSTLGQRLILAPFIGLIMALGAILLANAYTNKLPEPEEKRQALLPGIGTIIPALPDLGSDGTQIFRQAAPCLSLLRHLHHQVDYQERYQEHENEPAQRLITVTSPQEREGKSTIATGLALAAVQSGLQTLLIDANPHYPVLHTWFNLPNDAGMLDAVHAFVAGTASFLPIPPTSEPGLNVIPIGSLPVDTLADELPVNGLRPFMDLLRKQADIVIFDAPPLLTDHNTSNLVKFSDLTMLVVDAHKSQSDAIMEARRLLAILGAPSITVLNRSRSVIE